MSSYLLVSRAQRVRDLNPELRLRNVFEFLLLQGASAQEAPQESVSRPMWHRDGSTLMGSPGGNNCDELSLFACLPYDTLFALL